MNTYEKLEDLAAENKVEIIRHCFKSDRIKGLYCNSVIALNGSLKTTSEKACVLAEELGHYYTTVGDILDQSKAGNRKQERHARMWGYNHCIGLQGIIKAYKANLTDIDEVADFFNVTPQYFYEAIQCYRQKYGVYTTVDNYVIYFDPCLAVMEIV